jgi:hypothetical protein
LASGSAARRSTWSLGLHMRTPIVAAIVIVAAALAFVAGVKWGFDEGQRHFVYLDAPARGALDVSLLGALREGKTDFVTSFLEADVDSQILWHGSFLTEGHPFLLNPDQRAAANDAAKYMQRIAQYRKRYPSPTLPIFDENSPKGDDVQMFNRFLNERSRVDRATIDAVLSRYGAK